MNRRNFIKNTAIISIAVPAMVDAATLKPNLESVRITGEDIPIFTIEELQQYGLRSAIYSANCVDKNGVFAHETGYQPRHSEPFVRKTFVIKTLPRLFSKDQVPIVLGKMRSGLSGNGTWTKENVIEFIRETMEYVCLAWYCECPCLCGKCDGKTWLPVVGGLSKHRYNLYLKQMNYEN